MITTQALLVIATVCGSGNTSCFRHVAVCALKKQKQELAYRHQHPKISLPPMKKDKYVGRCIAEYQGV